MKLNQLPQFRTYDDIAEFLGNRESRRIANNTTVSRRGEREIGVILHNTYILTYHKIGEGNETATIIEFNSGGWQTSTTKQRINALSPLHIYQEKFSWFFDCKGNAYSYQDGMTLTLNFYGNIAEINAPVKPAKQNKWIKEYVLQGNYGVHGWEDLTAEETFRECKQRMREYEENEGGLFRIITRRVKNTEVK